MATKKTGPIRRSCNDSRYSLCGSAELHELDWDNWWEDDGYIHVRYWHQTAGETWHRVVPKKIKGRKMERVAVVDGWPHWLFDEDKSESP